jgi:serine phosphatase RsbU (regulator of sigma subunit)
VSRWLRAHRQLAWLLAGTTALGAAAAALIGVITVVPLFVLPATLAALSLPPATTAVVAAYACAWALVVSLQAHTFSSQGHGSGFAATVAVALVSVVAAGRRQSRETTLQKISLVAEAAQATIVRPIPSRLGALTFATIYRSAAEEARIGGDAYAAVAHADGVRLLVADVRGKGLEAIGLAADVLGSFREYAPGRVTLTDVARHLERGIAPSLGPEDFITALLVDFTSDQIGLVSCGHPWPLLRHGGTVSEITIPRPSPPLGLGIRPLLQTHPFHPGDQLIVFTDGLIEARDRRGSYFDPVAALRDVPADGAPRDVLDRLVASLDQHAGSRLGDDLAIVLAEYSADGSSTSLIEGVRVLTGEPS